MSFPNALKGIKKMFTSELLALISTICMGVTGAMLTKPDAPAAAVIVGLAASIVMIISFVLEFVGLANASKDDPFFKKGFIATIAGIALSALSSSFSENTFLASLFSTLSSIASLLVTLLVVRGIMNIAEKIGDENMINRGKNIFKMVAALYIIAIVIELIQTFVGKNQTMTTIAGVLAIAAAVISIIQYIVYLKYLNAAKKMLA